MRRMIIYLASNRIEAGLWKNGRWLSLKTFSTEMRDITLLNQFIWSHTAPVRILIDRAEEEFKLDTLPLLRKKEQQELVHRRLETQFPDTHYRRISLLSRNPDQSVRVLYSALMLPPHLAHWINSLNNQKNPLESLQSVASISGRFLRLLKQESTLLIHWQRHAGLRLSLFNQGALHFSRLISDFTDLPTATALSEEALRTWQYLANQGYISADQPITACLICDPDEQRQLQSGLSSDENIAITFLNTAELMQHIGVPASALGHGTQFHHLWMYLMASQPREKQYVSASHARAFQLFQIKRVAQWVAPGLLLAAMLAQYYAIHHETVLDLKAKEIQQGLSRLAQQDKQMTRALPPAAPATLRAAITLHHQLQTPTPEEMLILISQAMTACPEVQLEQLDWEITPSPAFQRAQLKIVFTTAPGQYRITLQKLEKFRLELLKYFDNVSVMQTDREKKNHPVSEFSVHILSRLDT